MLRFPLLTQIYRCRSRFTEILLQNNPLVTTGSATLAIGLKNWTQSGHKYSTTPADVVNNQHEGSDGNILKRVLNKVGFAPNTKTRLRVSSHMLYESVADKINYLSFFKAFDMPNTFNSWFLVTELHVWMLMVRAMAEGSESGENGRFLRNCIVEVMWSDVNARAKKLETHNPSKTRQQIEILSEQFQAALIAYDEGIMSDDRVLAGALWRRFFAMNCDDIIKIERLVKYVRDQVVLLDQLQRENFLQKPKIIWSNLDKITV
ncbi:ubiquinol-cytochrome-c reductase complex assembly factor 1 [Anastrepha ludens]|uniref:ubiquinol-cytochrome-c reductase complex assembly factor 1 n=1 Tax=Anastrepha ludens TaxID=28586 RepID=UPI0023B06D52|nr:ubiquinol-cytochrome-c reductase complex assembly factor 1 [Anastrepha ludens]